MLRRVLRKLRVLDTPLGRDFGYTPLTERDDIASLFGGWKTQEVAHRQRELANSNLADVRDGNSPEVFRIAVELIASVELSHFSLLDVGCASGYYSEVFERLNDGVSITYTGIDYSQAMIEMAAHYYRMLPFGVADAMALPFLDQAFDVVFSSAALMHVPDYALAIREHARVARRYVIFHRTPCLLHGATMRVAQNAYGTRYIDTFFGLDDLTQHFTNAGLRIVSTVDTQQSFVVRGIDEPIYTRSFVCVKVAQ